MGNIYLCIQPISPLESKENPTLQAKDNGIFFDVCAFEKRKALEQDGKFVTLSHF